MHLAEDAAERRVAVQTYIALVHDPDVCKDGELKAQVLPPALSRVFRNTADGLVKDDALPLTALADAIKATAAKSH